MIESCVPCDKIFKNGILKYIIFYEDYLVVANGNLLEFFRSNNLVCTSEFETDISKLIYQSNILYVVYGCSLAAIKIDRNNTDVHIISKITVNNYILDVVIDQKLFYLKNDTIYDFNSNKIYQYTNDILICGHIFLDKNNFISLGGNSFGDLLIKIFDSNAQSKIRVHNGAIFDIQYCNPYIYTASEDRTIKVMYIKDWMKPLIFIHHLYGHESRVFKILKTDSHLISLGEDGKIHFWIDNKIDRTLVTPYESAVTSAAWDSETQQLFTGTMTGFLYRWDLNHDISSKSSSISLPLKVKSIQFFSSDLLCGITTSHFFIYECQTNALNLIPIRDYDLEKCTAFAISPPAHENTEQIFVSLGFVNGILLVYRLQLNNLTSLVQIVGSFVENMNKIMHIFWLSSHHSSLLISRFNGTFDIVRIDVGKDKYSFTSNMCQHIKKEDGKCNHLWITAFAEVSLAGKKCLLLGDRRGALHAYEILDCAYNKLAYIESHYKIHDLQGITHIHTFLRHKTFILTTGKDGYICMFHIKSYHESLTNSITLELCYKQNFPGLIETIGRVWMSSINMNETNLLEKTQHCCLLLGFNGQNFIVFDLFHNVVIFQFACGGCHRPWHSTFNERDGIFCLTYVVKDRIVLAKKHILNCIPKTIKNGIKSKHLINIQSLTANCQYLIVTPLSGQPYLYSRNNNEPIHILYGIKFDSKDLLIIPNTLSSTTNDNIAFRVYTCGEKARIAQFNIYFDKNTRNYIYHEIINEKTIIHPLLLSNVSFTKIRYTIDLDNVGINIYLGTSHGYICTLKSYLNLNSNVLTLVNVTKVENISITSLQTINTKFVYTGDSLGTFNIFSINAETLTLNQKFQAFVSEPITAMDGKMIVSNTTIGNISETNCLLSILGGESGNIYIMLDNVQQNVIKSAHYGTITDLHIIPYEFVCNDIMFATVALDKRFIMWKLKFDTNAIQYLCKPMLIYALYTPDISSFCFSKTSQEKNRDMFTIDVCGSGQESFILNLNSIINNNID